MHRSASVLVQGFIYGSELAAFGVFVISIFLLHEMARVAIFSSRYQEQLWIKFEQVDSVENMDDDCLRALARIRLIRPLLRESGYYEAPFKDLSEPDRSKRAFRAPLTARWWNHRPGDMLASLENSWLARSNGKRLMPYMLYKVIYQVVFASIASFGIHPHVTTHQTVVMLVLLQVVAGVLGLRLAGDHLDSVCMAVESTLSAASLGLRYASAMTGNVSFRTASLLILGLAVSVPLALGLYDATTTTRIHLKARQFHNSRRMASIAAMKKRQKTVHRCKKWTASVTQASSEPGIASVIQLAKGVGKLRSSAPSRSPSRKFRLIDMMEARERMSLETLDGSGGDSWGMAPDEEAAALKINRIAKGRVKRVRFGRQRAERKVARDRRILERREARAATQINMTARGHISRRRSSRLYEQRVIDRDQRKQERTEAAAATKISSTYHGRAGRTRAQEAKARRVLEAKAASSINASVRGYLQRKRTRRKKAQKERKEERARVKAKAAITIAAAVRGFVQRTWYSHEKERLSRERRSIAQAEAAQRRRKRRETQERAALTMTTLARGWAERRRVRKRKQELQLIAYASSCPVPTEAPGADAPSTAAGLPPAVTRADAPAPAPANSGSVSSDDTEEVAVGDMDTDASREKAASAAEARAQMASIRGQQGTKSKMKPKVSYADRLDDGYVDISTPAAWA
jgi:hypothetical protein